MGFIRGIFLLLQMQFQQKQQHEIQQKRSQMAISRNISALDINDNSKFTASLGAGKVLCQFLYITNAYKSLIWM